MIKKRKKKSKIYFGTPVHDAIIKYNHSDDVKFRHKVYTEESMEAGHSIRISANECRIKMVDRETKKVFDWTAVHGMRQTENFINYYKFKTGSNVIGFFLTSSADDAGRVIGWRNWHDQRTEYNRLGYLIASDHGYDELYVIKSHSTVSIEDEINVDTSKQNSTATLARAFKKFQKGKLEKRIMLQSFAEKVA